MKYFLFCKKKNLLNFEFDFLDLLVFDPKIAAWMLKPGEAQPTLATMVMTFHPGLSGLLETLGKAKGQGSVAMNLQSHAKPRSRAVAESVLVLNLMKPLSEKLQNEGLCLAFEKIEMPSILILTLTHSFSEDPYLALPNLTLNSFFLKDM